MNTQKVKDIIETAVGGLLWAIAPLTGSTVNYAETATDELILLFAYPTLTIIGNAIGQQDVKTITNAAGVAAIGLLGWNAGQMLGYNIRTYTTTPSSSPQ